MFKLAWRNLTYDWTRLAISTGGVALALLLILVISGIFAGSEEHAVLYIRKQPAPLWLMQKGVANMHMSSSILPDDALAEARQVSGVEQAVGVLYANAGMEIGDTVVFNYVFGIEPDVPFGGPWPLAEGTTDLAPNEIIIDRVLAERYGLELGDTVQIAGNPLVIAGLAEDTFGIATSIVFVNKMAMSLFLGVSPDTDSYILIQPQEGIAIEDLAVDINAAVPEANLLTQEAFAESDQAMIRQMGADLLNMMSTIAYVIGFLVIGITTYTTTLEWSREYGVLKAIGANNRQLLGVVFIQAFIAAGLGYIAGVALAYGVAALINTFIPEMLVLIQTPQWLSMLPTLIVVTALAALLPIGRVMRLDPMVVFKA